MKYDEVALLSRRTTINVSEWSDFRCIDSKSLHEWFKMSDFECNERTRDIKRNQFRSQDAKEDIGSMCWSASTDTGQQR